jgi:hypothetical protein
MAAAISVAVALRPIGTGRASIRGPSTGSSSPPVRRGVSTGPGATALSLTPRLPHAPARRRMARVRASLVLARRREAGRIRPHGHRRRNLAFGEEREQPVEDAQRAEEVHAHDLFGGEGLRSNAGAHDQALEAVSTELCHHLDCLGPAGRHREVGNHLGVVPVDADHTGTASLEPTADGGADPGTRARDGDRAGPTRSERRLTLRCGVHGATL